MKISINYLIMRLIFLFPIVTLFSGLSAVNKTLSFLVLLLIFVSFLKNKTSRIGFGMIIATIFVTLMTFFQTNFPIIHVNEIAYLPFMCVYFVFIHDNIEKLKIFFVEEYRYINYICVFWSVLVLISMAFPSSYTNGVFESFSGTTFRISPSALFIICLSTVLIVTKGKKYILYSIIPYISVLMGASRTYLLICTICMAINLYFVVKNKKNYIAIMLVWISLVIVGISITSMGDKISSGFLEVSYRDPMEVFTSGRSSFWMRDLEAYESQPLFNRIFGCGFNFIREVNSYLGKERGIWAHNDFIQVVITNGVVGLLLYLYLIYFVFKNCISKKVPLFIRIGVFVVWIFNAFFNMYYTYTCSMLSLPIIMIACENKYLCKVSNK